MCIPFVTRDFHAIMDYNGSIWTRNSVMHGQLLKMKYIVSIVSALLLYETLCTFGVTYVLPTEPPDTPCPSVQNVCFTLNEWIESDTVTHPFVNGTTVSLLSGIHFINSTVETLLIKHVSSIVFSGQPHGQTTIECHYKSRFGFKFHSVREVKISNVIFKFCKHFIDVENIIYTLPFINSYNITLSNVKITNYCGVIAVIHSSEGSVFQ